MVEASLQFFPIDDVIEPFKIKFMDINDRFRTTIGFEFIYTGIEKNIDSYKVNDIFRMIYDHNKQNPHFQDIENNCPLLDEYIHDVKNATIKIIPEEHYFVSEMTIFRFQVFLDSSTFTFQPKESNLTCQIIPINFENNYLKPKYLLQYAFKLSEEIKKCLHYREQEITI